MQLYKSQTFTACTLLYTTHLESLTTLLLYLASSPRPLLSSLQSPAEEAYCTLLWSVFLCTLLNYVHDFIPQPPTLQCSQREYPVDREHPTHLTTTLQCTDRPSAINSCCFSGCGKHLTCACSDNTVYSMRMPLSLRKTHAFVGESIYHSTIQLVKCSYNNLKACTIF